MDRHLLLSVAIAACTVEVSLQGPNMQRLYNDLLSRYNRLVIPVSNHSQTLTVKFGINLMQIVDVDEKKQILTTNLWLSLNWNDCYLKWDGSEYPDVSNLRFPENLIWKPDIMLCNSADERFDPTFHTNIFVDSTGSCSYVLPGIFKSTCNMDVRWFPFDVQRCDLKFVSWTYGFYSLDLEMVEADTTSYSDNGEWDLIEVLGQRNQHVYACCEEPYPDVTYTLVMRRRTLFYVVHLLIPCVLISTLALFVFLLPADSGEKISLGIIVLLSLTVLLLLVAEIMPATSDSVPLIVQYLTTMMIIVGLSVIATVLVLQYHHHDPDGSKMPKWTRVILLNWCAWFLRMKRPGEEQVRSACHNKAMQGSMDVSAGSSAPPPTNDNMPYVGICSLESIHYSTAATSPDSAGQSSLAKSVEPELIKILDEVHYIAKRFRDQDEKKSVCNEWKFAASVIDRLCLVAFSLITILCTIVILMSAPNFVEAISKDLFS